MKKILPKHIVELWERAEQTSWNPKRTGVTDWKLVLVALKQELRKLQQQKGLVIN